MIFIYKEKVMGRCRTYEEALAAHRKWKEQQARKKEMEEARRQKELEERLIRIQKDAEKRHKREQQHKEEEEKKQRKYLQSLRQPTDNTRWFDQMALCGGYSKYELQHIEECHPDEKGRLSDKYWQLIETMHF